MGSFLDDIEAKVKKQGPERSLFLVSTGVGPGFGQGVVAVAKGQTPTSVAGKAVQSATWLGTTRTSDDVLKKNFTAATTGHTPLLLGADPKPLIQNAILKGSAWTTHALGGVADPTNDLIIAAVSVAGGIGVGRALGAAGAAATGGAEAAGEGAAVGTGTAAGGGAAGATAASKGSAALKAAAKAVDPKKALGALTVAGLFTNVGLWKGAAMCIAGAVLILIGILQLSGLSPAAATRRVV